VSKKHSEAAIKIQSRPASGPEIDYSPKTYTSRALLVSGVKLLLIVGTIMLLFFLIGKYI